MQKGASDGMLSGDSLIGASETDGYRIPGGVVQLAIFLESCSMTAIPLLPHLSHISPTLHPTMSHPDEDLDDFDDILDDFDAPPQAKASTSTSKPKPQLAGDDKNLEDELSRNMAALLASFGGVGAAGAPGAGSTSDPLGFPEGGEDELAKLLEQIMGSVPPGLDGEGQDGDEDFEKMLESLGQPPLPATTSTKGTTSKKAQKSTEAATNANGEALSFEETMRQTMNRMKESEKDSRTAADKVSSPP